MVSFFLFSFPGFGAATWERSSFFLMDSKRNTAATAGKLISIKNDEKSPTADLKFKKKTSMQNQLKEQQLAFPFRKTKSNNNFMFHPKKIT